MRSKELRRSFGLMILLASERNERPSGATLRMRSDGVSGVITAQAISRWIVNKFMGRFIRQWRAMRSKGICWLSALRRALLQKREYCRPIREAWRCGRYARWRAHKASRPDRSRRDRAYREYISGISNGRRRESARRAQLELCSRR